MSARLTPVDGGSAYRLEKPIVLIGRHEDCDLSLVEQVKISRRHCCVARIDDRYVVRDLGSMNGVRVNGTRVNQAELRHGDNLAIADTVFVFEDGTHLTGNEAVIPCRTTNGVGERVSNPSGDVLLVRPEGGISEDMLPTPRMLEPSGRDEIVPAQASPQVTNDSQSGLRFIGA